MKKAFYCSPDGVLVSTLFVQDDFTADESQGYVADEPPGLGVNQAVVRANGAWEIVADFRGHRFHDPATGEEVLVTSIGETPPSGWLAGAAPVALPQLKAAKWAAMKARRDEVEFGGFTWDGSTFDSEPVAQSRLQGGAQLATLAQLSGAPFSVEWTLADNQVRTLDGAEMLAVGAALGQHILQTHVVGRQVRAQIEACGTAAEVAQISWP